MVVKEGTHVLIIGAGKSGIAAAKLLSGEKADIVLYDSNKDLDKDAVLEKIGTGFTGRIVGGEMTQELKDWTEHLIVSPAVPMDIPDVLDLKAKNIPVWGEVELAYRFEKGRVIAITGTNGKTTTTALTGEMMKTYFSEVFVVGNIGIPYTEEVTKSTKDSISVAEMSSFQLETIEEFHPVVSMVLNITPDHLNRHHTMEAYTAAKMNIAMNQTPDETCVLNYEDERLREEAKKLGTKIIWFSSRRELPEGLFVRDEHIIYRDANGETDILNVNEMNIIGRHNHENAMAAVAAGLAMKLPLDCIRKALREFVAVEHRIEYTATVNDVKYYNDSKGTNPDASIQAVNAMQTSTLLIGGGYDKGSTYDEWIDTFGTKVRWLILMGQTADKIEACARSKGFTAIKRVNSMEEAVEFCYGEAKPGECVLLSPCCASWGMFKNYEERGRIFKDLVRALPGAVSSVK